MFLVDEFILLSQLPLLLLLEVVVHEPQLLHKLLFASEVPVQESDQLFTDFDEFFIHYYL